jgi:hypothetical protein
MIRCRHDALIILLLLRRPRRLNLIVAARQPSILPFERITCARQTASLSSTTHKADDQSE